MTVSTPDTNIILHINCISIKININTLKATVTPVFKELNTLGFYHPCGSWNKSPADTEGQLL